MTFKRIWFMKNSIPIIHGKAELEQHDAEVRAKAIDEFAEKLKRELDIKFSFGGVENKFKLFKAIDEIAEQLKVGGK